MQTRPADFFDVNERRPRYGIKIKDKTGRWILAGDDDGIFLFDTKSERDSRREELRKAQLPGST